MDDDDSFPPKKFALTVPPFVQGTTLIGSSHGLLCMLDSFRQPDDTSKTQMVVLWNPAIRKSIVVVVPNVVCGLYKSVVGFGVCPNTKDPKLVKITYIDDYKNMESITCISCQVMVFTLSSGEWTTSSTNPFSRKLIEFDNSSQTNIGQLIYYHAYYDREGEPHNQIMFFDLNTNEFREVDFPERLLLAYNSISGLRESLVLLEYDISFPSDYERQVCRVWIMEAFTKLFTIKPPHASVAWTLGFRKSGKPIIEMKDNHNGCKKGALVVYEPCSRHVKDLGICGTEYSPFVYSYMKSLLLLDHDDGHFVSLRCGVVKS